MRKTLRTNSNIKSIFEDLHNTNELVTSFDGFSVFTSPKQDTGKWLHIDLNEYHPWVDEFCPQGAYNFFKVDTSDAGFVVVPYSHETYKPPDDITQLAEISIFQIRVVVTAFNSWGLS